MPDGKDGVIKQHPRSGKPHHLPDFLTHFRFIAVDLTVAAESLLFHKRTLLASQSGVVKKLLAFRTQLPLLPVRFLMFLSAVQADHFTHHVLFFSPSLFDIFHFSAFSHCTCVSCCRSAVDQITASHKHGSRLPGLSHLSSLRLRYIGLASRNRAYLCKEIHVFKQDQKKDKRPAIHILHCQECQNQHTGSRNEQAEFCL